MSLDSASAAANALIAEVSTNLEAIHSEQDARFQLINRFLTEVLEWPFPSIETEPHGDSGYADYLINEGDRATLVIEAKKTGHILLDTESHEFRHYKVGGPAIRSASDGIRQAIGYCTDHGARYAVVTTGLTWIVFLPFPGEGISYKEGQAFVFPDLASIRDNFAAFYDLLARESVAKKLYKAHFAKAEGLKAAPYVVLHSVAEPARRKLLTKTPIASDLDSVFREFFSDIAGDDDPDMLMHCFVETKQSEFADATMQKIVENIVSSIESMSTGSGDELLAHIEAAAETGRGETILLVGGPSSGKSTFIKRFFRLVLGEQLKQKCLTLSIDLKQATGDVKSVIPWLIDMLRKKAEAALFPKGYPTYEELQGLYYPEYQRMRDGLHKPLYESDKVAFKAKFSEEVERRQISQPSEYVLRLLDNAVKSRKLLPCLVFDNVDHYPQDFQDAIFQYAQSIQQALPFAFIIIPITDRTIWKLSKTGALQAYRSHSLYLPVPSTKDVISKRVTFLHKRIASGTGNKDPKTYFLGKGIRVNIESLSAFAACLEEVFLNTDYVSRRISWLANHNIKRGLDISQAVMTSPHLSVDDLVASFIKGDTLSPKRRKIMLSLLFGAYNSFWQGDNSFILNVFSVSPSALSSPLTKLSILRLLIDAAGQDQDTDKAYVSIRLVQLHLEAMGIAEEASALAVAELLDYRLVEPFDPSIEEKATLAPDFRMAVTFSGRMHYEMALNDSIYVGQMAFSSGLREQATVEELRAIKLRAMGDKEWQRVLQIFARYCLDQDAAFVALPKNPEYESQRQLRDDFRAKWTERRQTPQSDLFEARDSLNEDPNSADTGRSYFSGKVRWFNSDKGYGFITQGDGKPDAFIHISHLKQVGIDALQQGDVVECDIATEHSKAHVIKVHSVTSGTVAIQASEMLDGKVIYFNPVKKFGFVKASSLSKDVFFNAKTLTDSGNLRVFVGDKVKIGVVVSNHEHGGYQAVLMEKQ